MIKTTRLSRIVMLFSLLLAVSVVEASGPPPVAAILCEGCNNIGQTSASGYTAVVGADAIIILSGNYGYQSYAWTQNGLWISNAQKITVKITSNTQYSLTVIDYGGIGGTVRSDTKTVQINLASVEQSTGVPDLADIAVDSDYLNRIDFAVGDYFSIKTDYDKNQYPGIIFGYAVDGGELSGLLIENPNSTETRACVKAKPIAGKNPVIRAHVTNGISSREKNVTIEIVDNTGLTVKGRYTYTTTTPLSHTEFQVSCSECWTGNGYNENSDFISEFTARLRDGKGQIISDTATAKRGEILRTLKLKPGDEGNYTIEVIAKDSHGLSSSVVESLPVGFGNTEDDIPFIVANSTIFCTAAKPCSIDLSKTYTHDLGASVRFYDVTAGTPEPLYNIGGKLCTTFNCTKVFNYSYTYKVRITMAYIRNSEVADKYSEKTVTVIVSERGAQVPVQTPQTIKPISTPVKIMPTAKLTPQPPPGVPARPTPEVNPSAIFAAFAAAAFLRRKNNKP